MNFGAGMVWTDITAGLLNAGGANNQLNVAYEVALKPDCVDTLYLSGQTRNPATSAGARFGTVFKSSDSGTTFSNVFLLDSNPHNAGIFTGWVGSSSYPAWAHTWRGINTIEGIDVDSHNADRLMISDFSGVHVSFDGGQAWVQRYTDAQYQHPPGVLVGRDDIYKTSGLQTTVCYWMHWFDPAHILASYADLVINVSLDSGKTWSFDHDSLWTVKANDVHMFCPSPSGRIFAPTGEVLGNNGDFRDYRVGMASAGRITWSDNGTNWHQVRDFHTPVSWISLDPANPATMYAAVYSPISGSGGIWKRCLDQPYARNPCIDLYVSPGKPR